MNRNKWKVKKEELRKWIRGKEGEREYGGGRRKGRKEK